jgi:hypothetical protein
MALGLASPDEDATPTPTLARSPAQHRRRGARSSGPRARRVEQESDAGSIAESVELVPPSYNPIWASRRNGTSPS